MLPYLFLYILCILNHTITQCRHCLVEWGRICAWFPITLPWLLGKLLLESRRRLEMGAIPRGDGSAQARTLIPSTGHSRGGWLGARPCSPRATTPGGGAYWWGQRGPSKRSLPWPPVEAATSKCLARSLSCRGGQDTAVRWPRDPPAVLSYPAPATPGPTRSINIYRPIDESQVRRSWFLDFQPIAGTCYHGEGESNDQTAEIGSLFPSNTEVG